MRTLLLQYGIFFSFVLLTSIESFAQWQSDIRLTNDLFSSVVSLNNARCVASSGNDVHVVLDDDRNGNEEIYYKRSTNGGINWESDSRIINDIGQSNNPSIAVSGSVVHVVWRDNRDGNAEIYYKNSTDGGTNWGTDTRLSINSSSSEYPSIAVSGMEVHVVWRDFRDGNNEIYYKRSADGGTTWAAETRLTNALAPSYEPSIAVSGSTIHVAWYDTRAGNDEIFYKRSIDGGLSWEGDIRLTNNSASSYESSISVSGSDVNLVWRDNRDGNFEIYYKHSPDGGSNWSEDVRLTNDAGQSWYPSISVSDEDIHVVWMDNRDAGVWEIYYKHSDDGGTTWDADTRLTSNDYFSWYPFVASSSSGVHVVWQDIRDGNWEIYYKQNPTGNITAINDATAGDLGTLVLDQNIPNPVNSTSVIHFKIPCSGYVTLDVYDIMGNKVTTLVNDYLSKGNFERTFDGSLLPDGLYSYCLYAGGIALCKKLLVQK